MLSRLRLEMAFPGAAYEGIKGRGMLEGSLCVAPLGQGSFTSQD